MPASKQGEQAAGVVGLGVGEEEAAGRAKGQVRAPRAPIAGGKGQEGVGDPTGNVQNLAVEGSGLDGEVLDVALGHGDAGGHAV